MMIFCISTRITRVKSVYLIHGLLLVILLNGASLQAEIDPPRDVYKFKDTLLEEELQYPDWFKTSFGDLREDLKSAIANNKQGLMIYFGQKRCSYCEMFLKVNLEMPDVQGYLRKHFDVIPIDIWGINDVITLEGDQISEREYAIFEETNFTPSLIFYDKEGRVVLRLRGYYPPYKFRAALKYVVEGFYRQERLREYMARADSTMIFDPEGLNEEDFFVRPPYNLDRSRFPAERPLVVFFEQGKCHACDVLHTGPLTNKELREEVQKMEAVQLDMWSNTPVVTPSGEKTTAKEWARRLGLFYAPAMVFFDEKGNEVIRVDAVAQFYRLLGVFGYMNKRAYIQFPNYQQWRITQRSILK